jgi:Uma2 family endonuclease
MARGSRTGVLAASTVVRHVYLVPAFLGFAKPPAISCGGHGARAALNRLPATQDELELGHFEFLHGCIVAEPPASWPHGTIGATLGAFVRQHRLGFFFDSSQGCALPSGDMVEPDAAVILRKTWDAAPAPRRGFLRIVPDLIVEVLSPGTA